MIRAGSRGRVDGDGQPTGIPRRIGRRRSAGAVRGPAQQPDRFFRIGMIERTSIGVNAVNVQSFRQGLRDLGYVEGEHFVIEYRSAEGQDQRYPGLVSELARLKVDLIVTRGTPAALAAKSATGAIPVVIIGVGDPVGSASSTSLAHPGGNVTGLSAAVTQIYPKRVQLLRELVPRATRIARSSQHEQPRAPVPVAGDRAGGPVDGHRAAPARRAKGRGPRARVHHRDPEASRRDHRRARHAHPGESGGHRRPRGQVSAARDVRVHRVRPRAWSPTG